MRTKIAQILIFLFALSLPKVVALQDNYGLINKIKKADDLYLAKEYKKVIDLLSPIEFQDDDPDDLKLKIYLKIGQSAQHLGQYAIALDWYLQGSDLAERKALIRNLEKIDLLIGNLFLEWKIFDKAIPYYEKIITSSTDKESETYFQSLKGLASSYKNIQDLENSIEYYLKVKEWELSNGRHSSLEETLQSLSNLYNQREDYSNALKIEKELLEKFETEKDFISQAKTLNNIGYLQQLIGDTKNALNSFNKARLLFKENSEVKNANQLAVISQNIGFILLLNGNSTTAINEFSQCLDYRKLQNDTVGIAKALNNIASAYALNNDFYPAKQYSEEALRLGIYTNNIEVKLNSHKILSTIYEKLKFYKRSLEEYKLYADLSDSIITQAEKQRGDRIKRELDIEKKEKELRILMADRQIDNLELRRLSLENEKRNQELEILLKEQALIDAELKQEILAREKTKQELELIKKESENEKKDQEITNLIKDKKITELALSEQKLREKEREKDLQLLESEKKLQALKLKDEGLRIRWISGVLVLIGALLLLSIFVVYQKQRSNRILSKTQAEILQKNIALENQKEELTTTAHNLQIAYKNISEQNEEIQLQKDRLAETLESLSRKNLLMTESIQYANSIQQAVLPKKADFLQFFSSIGILYLPRDIVSGDFYWLYSVSDKENASRFFVFLAMVDCTGHGVPGAFMSLIGTTLLNKIVGEMGIIEPYQILGYLNDQLAKELKQKGEVSDDGMEVSLIRLEFSMSNNGKIPYVFAGAKHGLFIYDFFQKDLRVVNGNNRGIGGFYTLKKRPYSQQTGVLTTKDRLFMFTDGLRDQCNPEREKLHLQPVIKLLQKEGGLPAEILTVKVQQLLLDFKGNADQRDDITFMAVSF